MIASVIIAMINPSVLPLCLACRMNISSASARMVASIIALDDLVWYGKRAFPQAAATITAREIAISTMASSENLGVSGIGNHPPFFRHFKLCYQIIDIDAFINDLDRSLLFDAELHL